MKLSKTKWQKKVERQEVGGNGKGGIRRRCPRPVIENRLTRRRKFRRTASGFTPDDTARNDLHARKDGSGERTHGRRGWGRSGNQQQTNGINGKKGTNNDAHPAMSALTLALSFIGETCSPDPLFIGSALFVSCQCLEGERRANFCLWRC